MIVQQFFVKKIAHSSYLLGGSSNCAIIDPRRDIDIYIKAAKEWGMKITHIIETHLHADFISGHMDLAAATGAKIVAPASANCAFEHLAVKEGDVFHIDELEISVLETPGHTPEHVSYVVTNHARGDEPVAVFTGDTIFVGDVGRPDLFPNRAEELAEKLYNSVAKIMELPDHVELYPAHGAGSLCGKAMGAKRTSTVGYEKRYNPALQKKDLEEFKHSLIDGMPEVPDHFARCSAINGKGPKRLKDLPEFKALSPREIKKITDTGSAVVVDTRDYDAFSGHHIPGAYHISIFGNFPIFSGWIIPPDKDIILVSDDKAQALEAKLGLIRVGMDNVIGYLEGGMSAWAKKGMPEDHVCLLGVEDLHKMIEEGNEKIYLIDTRAPGEFEGGHIEGSVNIPTPELRTRYNELERTGKKVFLCNSGNRSSLGVSIVQQHGIKDLYNLSGGMTGFAAAGYAPECAICKAPHLPEKKDRQ